MPNRDTPRILGWAAFLASSWTWCIGMWLPVLLIRDYGPISFLIFAFPNCIGAAAMGLVLRRLGEAEHLARCHAPAAQAFSFVTTTFQWFFVGWLIGPIAGHSPTWALGAALLVCFACTALAVRRGTLLAVSGIVYLASLALLAWWLLDAPWSAAPPQALVEQTPDPRPLLHLTPVIIFGFIFCPYLDLTFLYARRQLPGQAGTAAFVIGFLSLFFVMILGTFLYSSPTLSASLGAAKPLGPDLLPWLLALHVALQLGFTIGAHAGVAGLAFWRSPDDSRPRPGTIPPTFLLATAVGLLLAAAAPRFATASLTGHEALYRLFMGFYALAFPAYVWLCVIPRNGPVTRPSPRHLAVCAAAVALAAPLFFVGFILRQETYLLPGLAIVLLARLFIPLRRVPPEPIEPSPAPAPVPPGPGSLAAPAPAGPATGAT